MGGEIYIDPILQRRFVEYSINQPDPSKSPLRGETSIFSVRILVFPLSSQERG